MEGFNIDLPPLPALEGLEKEEMVEELNNYLRRLTISLEEMFRRVHNRGRAVKNSVEVHEEEIQLVGDEDAPGNSKYYGTDGSGNKGWYAS